MYRTKDNPSTSHFGIHWPHSASFQPTSLLIQLVLPQFLCEDFMEDCQTYWSLDRQSHRSSLISQALLCGRLSGWWKTTSHLQTHADNNVNFKQVLWIKGFFLCPLSLSEDKAWSGFPAISCKNVTFLFLRWAWVLQDALGIAFCLYMLKTIRLPTFKVWKLNRSYRLSEER